MSYMDNFHKALKKKLEEEENIAPVSARNSQGSVGSGAVRNAIGGVASRNNNRNERITSEEDSEDSFMDRFYEKLAEIQETERSIDDRMTVGQYAPGDSEPVRYAPGTAWAFTAPVKEEEEKRTWLQKGAFEDGYQIGDVTKTILGTITDFGQEMSEGIAEMPENIIDTAAMLIGNFGSDAFQDKMDAFVQKDLYDSEAISKNPLMGAVNPTLIPLFLEKMFKDESVSVDVDDYSAIGERTESLANSVGQMIATRGLQAYTGIPWWVTTGVTSFGSEAENALNQGATHNEAVVSSAVSAGAEILTESLFGGSGLGEKGMINLAPLTSGISNKVVKVLADYGLDIAAEGSEEVVSQIFSNLGSALYREEKLWDILTSEEALDGYLESFISGGALGGIMNVGKVSNSVKTGRDYRTGLNANEQKVFDQIYEERIAEAEKDHALSKSEKAEIYDEVMEDIQKGYLDIEDIGRILGGESYEAYKTEADKVSDLRGQQEALQKEYEKLGKKDRTIAEQIRYNELPKLFAELQTKIDDPQSNANRNRLQAELNKKVFDLVKNDMLVESYHERVRSETMKFQADLNKYKGRARDVIKQVMDSGLADGSRRTHEFWDIAANLAENKGMDIAIADQKQILDMLKAEHEAKGIEFDASQFDGKIIDGYTNGEKIFLNAETKRGLNFVVGHEITHTMEGGKHYDAFQKLFKEYAKGEYQSRFDERSGQYKKIYAADEKYRTKINREVTADLVGDYLFNDKNFVRHLTKNQNVFQAVWNEIKYLCKIATAGSQQARQLEKVKREFERAWRERGKAQGDAKLSVSDEYGDRSQFEVIQGYTPRQTDSDGIELSDAQQEYFKDSKMRDEQGNLKVMYHGSQDAGFHVFDARMSDDDTSFFFVDRNDVAATYSGSYETYEARAFTTAEDANKFFERIGKTEYQVVEKNGKYALIEDGGRTVFTVAESDSVADLYEEFCDYEGVGYGDANYKVYLNLTNPLVVDAEGRNWNNISREFSQEVYDRYQSLTAEEKAALADLAEWGEYGVFRDEILSMARAKDTGAYHDADLASAYEKLGGANANLHDAFTIASDNFSEETLREFAVKQMNTREYAQKAKTEGYDGVIFKNIVDNGGYSNGSEGASTVAIAFESNQIKSVANENPTKDADIRYSVSDDGKAEVVGGIAVATNTAEVMKSPEYSKPKDYMAQYSVSTTPAWEKNYRTANHGAEADLVVKAIRDFTDKMVQDDAVRGYVPMGDYKASKMGPLRTNQEYIWTFDMDTSCPRTFQFLNFRDAIQRKAGRYLTYNESINLLELMRAYGQQIPCCYCYVENKRVLLSSSYNNFFNFRNAVMTAETEADAVKAMYGYSEKKGLPDASKKALARWRADLSYNPSVTDVWTATNTARNSVLNFLDSQMAAGNISTKTAESRLNKMVLDEFGIEDKGAIVEIEGFVRDWAYDTLANIPHIYNTENNTDVSVVDERALALNHEALAYSKSASSAKSVENYAPYTDQLKNVSEEDRQYIMGMGGIRKHSSNDFRMDYVQDYFLFYADLAAGKWTGHTYTKSGDFTKIFACTGDRINMSVAFYEDADGTLRENTDEGAFWKEVQELRKAYKNVGAMAMVTSDNQLSYALNADWIDMIIPFHASGLDKSVWYNLRMWNDYTSKQGERFYNADTMKQKLKDAGVEIPKGANASAVKALFEQTFPVKKIYGKNGEVVKPHFFPGDTYVNGQLVPGHHNDAQAYFKLCEEYGVHPRFYGIKVADKYGNQIDVTEHPAYLKLIKETSRTDTAQEAIQFNFGNYDDYLKMTPFEYAMQRLQEEAKNGGFENTKADPYGVVKEFTEEYLNQNRPLGYLTERAKNTREALLEMSRETARQQSMSVSDVGQEQKRGRGWYVPSHYNPVQTEVAPTQTEVAPVQENLPTIDFPDDLAPVQAELESLIEEEAELRQVMEGYAGVNDIEAVNRLLPEYEAIQERIRVLQQSEAERTGSITDADAPVEQELFPGDTHEQVVSDPFEERDIADVGNRKVKAYMYENPEVKPFFQREAAVMLGDLQSGIRGERIYNDEVHYATGGEKGWMGTSRKTTADIAELLDTWHYTYAEIEKGLKAIIEDNGKENNAVSKRIEFMLHDRLMNGYKGVWGEPIPPEQDYIDFLYEKQINEYSKEAFDNFMANADLYAPAEEVVEAPVAEVPTETVEPVAPAQNPVEAIRPKPQTQPRMARATPEEQAIADILTEEPKAEKKSGAVSWVKNHVLDKGMVFEGLSLATGNRELQARWNSIRYADGKAQKLIGEGATGVQSLNSLRETVEKSGKTKQFYAYLYHMHNVDRMTLEERYKDTPNKTVFGDTITAEVSRDVAAKLEKANPMFKQWAKEVYKYNSYLREQLVDGGVISRETAKLWEEMYPHYVPIRRTGDTGLNINVPLDTGRTGVNAPIKRATGGSSDILPLFDTMGQRTMQTFKAIAKNRFGVELKNTLGTTIAKDAPGIDETIDNVDRNEGLLKKGENGRKPTFTVFENGERVTFEITEEMYDAMKPTSDALSYTNKVANAVSNFRRGTLTEYNPWFLLKNAIKDVQDVFLNSQHSLRTYGAMPKAIKQMKTKGHWYQEYMENGGGDNTYFDKETNTFQEENKALETVKTVTGLNLIAKANNIIERLPRLAEYIASRESGRSVDVAMLDAARVTTNFAAGGDLTKFLNRNGATFLNASVQGAIQQVRNVREAKANGVKGVIGLAAKYLAIGIPTLVLNHLVWDDDEEYEELSDYVKQNYYIVGKYGDGQFVRIPKGRMVAVIQNTFNMMDEVLTGDDDVDMKTFLDMAWDNLTFAMSNVAPNNPIENNILSPIIQVANNETWYGEDLVPTRLQDLPAAEQYDESTDSFSRWLGEKTNTSPYKWNYLLDQYSGVIGDTFLPMITPEAESGDDSFLGNVIAPLKDMFTTDSTMNNQNVSDFYDLLEELTVNANASTATDEDELMSKYMNSINSELSKLYQQKREIQNMDIPDADKYEMVKEIQEQIVDLMKEGMANYQGISYEDDYRGGGTYARVADRLYELTDEGEWKKLTDEQVTKYEVTKAAGDAAYASDGTNHYRWYEPEEGSESEPGWRKITEKELERQEEITSGLGISPEEYWEKREEYSYAYEHPESYAVAQAVGGYDAWVKYSEELYDIKADKDEYGKSISGSRKDHVIDYLNSLDADYYTKIILFKSEYNADDTYNEEIIDYLNSREDISYAEMEAILKKLGFYVDAQGNISW